MRSHIPLVRPAQSQVKIEPTAMFAESDGFMYPTFRLLNKQTRIAISSPYELSPVTHYHLLAIANSRGWFAGARFNRTSYELRLSTLEDLRSASKAAKAGEDNNLPCKRIISLPQGKPNILTFANHDSSLFVALEEGTVLRYDTAALFSPGEDPIQPTHTVKLQASALKQIVANPGTEPGLVDRIAVVADGFVELFNMELEPQSGWSASDSSTTPAAVAWSPKGKHIAIGLQGGDILTFALTNLANPHKHIPPTFQGALISLSWPGPGHTFRTGYASAQGPTNPALHIVHLDTKSNTGTYFSLAHPFVSGDRSFQSSYLLHLPKWDEDSSSSEHFKSLFVFGDSSSIDLEVLAHDRARWFQQSQENPLSLPLNKDMDDTTLLSLDLDLTETSTSTPIVYAYLNDGTIQGWHLEHSKPYPLMANSTPTPLLHVQAPDAIQTDMSMSTEQDQSSKLVAPAFSQPVAPSSGFGQSGFGAPAFGSAQAYVQPAVGSIGFAAFSSTSPRAFGQATTQQSNVASPFNATSSTPSPFGAFGAPAPAFGSGSLTNAFSSHSGSFVGTNNTPAFGQTGFGSQNTAPAFGSTLTPSPATDMTREASMADGTPGFGDLSLGASSANDTGDRSSGIFGPFNSGESTAQTETSMFGGVIKPATAFGSAFTDSPFMKANPSTHGSASSFAPAPATNANPVFGQTGFGQPTLAKPAFGQNVFGSIPAAATTASLGGFGSFANKPASFTGVSSGGTTATFAGGGSFNAFAGSGAESFASALPSTSAATIGVSTVSTFRSTGSTFGNVQSAPSTFGGSINPAQSVFAGPITKPATFGGSIAQSPLVSGGNKPPSLVFAAQTPSTSGGVSPKLATPAFGSSFPSTPSEGKPLAKKEAPKVPPGISSPPSSPEPTPAVTGSPVPSDGSPPTSTLFRSSQPPVTSGAFGNLQTSPSAFRPLSGYGAFGSNSPSESSPFFKKPEQKAPVSVFANVPLGNGSKSTSSAPFAAPGKPITTPTFGTPSLLGAQNSVFPPPTPPSPTPAKNLSAFGAFSGPPATLSAFSVPSASGSSFTDLLKTGDGFKDPVKPQANFDAPALSFGGKEKGPDASMTPPKEKGEQPETVKVEEPAKKPASPDTLAADTSFGDISSAGSSFVEVKSETKESETRTVDTDEERDETRSIHSDEYGSDGSYEPGASDEELSDDHDYEEDDESHEGEDAEEKEDGDGESEEERQGYLSPEPATVPLPPSRSSSATPQPEVPNIKVTPSAERSGSTTPPGTPEKDTNLPPRRSPSPSPTSGTVMSPFGIGLGRPSTRPTRSSPLASAPVSGDNEEEDSKRPLLTPKLAGAVPPVKAQLLTTETPITFSKSLPMPSTPVLAHAKPPIRPAAAPLVPQVEKPPAVGPPLPSLFSAPSAPEQSSLFGPDPPATANIAPPSSNFFGTFLPTKPVALPIPSNTTPEVAQPSAPSNFFGAAGAGKVTTPFSLSAFSLASSQPLKAPAPAPNFFGLTPPAPPAPVSSIFGSAPAPSPFGAPSLFGGQGFMITPQSGDGLFGAGSTPKFSLAPKPAGVPVPSLTPLQPPELSMEEGMQKECGLLILSLNKELEELRLRAQQVNQRRQHFGKSVGGSWNRPDLGDPVKWGLGDLRQFGQVLPKFGEDLATLREQRGKTQQGIRELNSSLLKANTRREEIARFTKAKTDPEFARMLKTRTLGPEHSETQTQLRRGIRTMRDRITKLESHLQSSKKILTESVSGKPTIKAPTLDTVNRTYRNIEIVLSQQATEVAKLVSRFEGLDLDKATLLSTPSRDSRLPDLPRRPYNVTPNVAATTAAALNAERGAHKLKKALLAVREQPLLNINVNASEPPPVAFSSPQPQATPHRPTVAGVKFSPVTPFSFPSTLGSAVFTPPNASALPDTSFSLPDDDFSPTTSLPMGATSRRAGSAKKHSTVQLPKKSPGSTPTFAPSFDWGPLPTFNNPPLNSLAASFITKKP